MDLWLVDRLKQKCDACNHDLWELKTTVKMKNFLSLVLLLMSVGVVNASNASIWTTNYQSALDQAKVQKKLVLLSFTGDDPYGYGKQLDSQVLRQTAFTDYAKTTFILVAVNLSTKASLPDTLKQQNNSVARQFHVNGFPTLVVVSAGGKAIGRQDGYDPSGGLNAVMAKLKNLSKGQ